MGKYRWYEVLSGQPLRDGIYSFNPFNPKYKGKGKGNRQQSAAPGPLELRTQGKDNPFVLEIEYNPSVETTDGSGDYVPASSAYFDPTGLPGWSYLKNLFKEFRLVEYSTFFQAMQGIDANGIITLRATQDPAETISAYNMTEKALGAELISLSNLDKGFVQSMRPDTAEEAQWHLIDATTDANNFGYAKEFGQIFVRGSYLPANTPIFSFNERARVVFRGFKGS